MQSSVTFLSAGMVCAVVCGHAALDARAADPTKFIQFNFDRYNNGVEANSNDLAGRLFVPQDYDPNKKYAVVTFLHGLGETGANSGVNSGAQINSNINNLFNKAASEGFILYAPQVYSGWGVTDNLDLVANQIARITRQYNVDHDRFYLTGLSLGGGGTMDLLGRYNHIFAGAVNICGSDNGVALQPAKIKDTPLWIHHGTSDGTVNVSFSRNRVNAIRNAKGLSNLSYPVPGNFYDDGTLRYTEYPGSGHNIWSEVYGQQAVYDWLLPKKKTVADLQLGETIKFDVGGTKVTGLVDGQTWNSTNYGLHLSVGAPVLAFASTVDGKGTRVHLELTRAFGWETASVSNPAKGDGWAVGGSDVGGLKISGLVPGAAYDVELFATGTTNGASRFTVNGVTQDLNYFNNVANTSLFSSVIADATGAIAIDVRVASGVGQINWLSVTAVPEPAMLGVVAPAALAALRRRRR